ncbi:hypothetical protein F4779DRAFT_609362 [Xylariaceae sp. FL0662B]|nr:hypothetical protein F4779DRAFT_609362 [Xylariaceae sp. FL0662B]
MSETPSPSSWGQVVMPIIELREQQDLLYQDREPDPASEVECDVCVLPVPIKELTTLPCKHSFHCKCLIEWLETHVENGGDASCPYCRASLYYTCGAIISKRLLRPGVTILPEELASPCLCVRFPEPFDPASIAQGRPPLYMPHPTSDENSNQNADAVGPRAVSWTGRFPHIAEEIESRDEPTSPNRNTPTDWDDVFLDTFAAFDAAELRRLLRQHLPRDDTRVIFMNTITDGHIPADSAADRHGLQAQVQQQQLDEWDFPHQRHCSPLRPKNQSFRFHDSNGADAMTTLGRPREEEGELTYGRTPYTKAHLAYSLDRGWRDATDTLMFECHVKTAV